MPDLHPTNHGSQVCRSAKTKSELQTEILAYCKQVSFARDHIRLFPKQVLDTVNLKGHIL